MEVYLRLAFRGGFVDAGKGRRELLANLRLHLAPRLPHLFLVRLYLVERRYVTLGDLVMVLHTVL